MQTLGEPQEVRWFNLLSAVAAGALGPGLALTAIALAVFNKHLLIAVVIAASALVIYAMPLIAFMIPSPSMAFSHARVRHRLAIGEGPELLDGSIDWVPLRGRRRTLTLK
jgi:hypothetical protein